MAGEVGSQCLTTSLPSSFRLLFHSLSVLLRRRFYDDAILIDCAHVDVLHQFGCLQPPEHPPSRAQVMLSATTSIFRITAIALSTLLNRFAASVRILSAANGDTTTLVVLRCI